jgi:hypothetical protein
MKSLRSGTLWKFSEIDYRRALAVLGKTPNLDKRATR